MLITSPETSFQVKIVLPLKIANISKENMFANLKQDFDLGDNWERYPIYLYLRARVFNKLAQSRSSFSKRALFSFLKIFQANRYSTFYLVGNNNYIFRFIFYKCKGIHGEGAESIIIRCIHYFPFLSCSVLISIIQHCAKQVLRTQ